MTQASYVFTRNKEDPSLAALGAHSFVRDCPEKPVRTVARSDCRVEVT